MDQRLVQLPGFIAAGIAPETIVFKINEDLQKEFARSTIPQTAHRLGVTAKQIEETHSKLVASIRSLGNSYRGAAEEARGAIATMEEAISRTAATVSRAARDLSTGFHHQYWWSVFVLTTVALVLGFVAGMLFMHQLQQLPRSLESVSAPVIQEAPLLKAKNKK